MMSRSSVAFACIDRYALCSRKVCIRQLSNSRVAIVSIIIISILWLILPIHVLIYTDIQMPGERCGASGTYLIIYSIYAAIVTSIPLIIMIIFSFLAVENLRDSRARTHPMPSNTSIPIRKRDIQLMTMLISDVTVYFLSTVWFPIYTIYLTITINVSKTADRLAVEGFIRYLTLNFLIFINSCSIFYIHLFTSKAFYHECKQLILRLFKINQNNRVCQGVILTPNLQHRLNDLHNQRQTVANSTIT